MDIVILIVLVTGVVIWISRSRGASSTPTGIDDTAAAGSLSESDENRDAWEGSFWEAEAPYPVAATLKLRYCDANQSVTERTVTVRQVGSVPGASLLIAHCHMRDATRTFRSDRIRECVDVETGEVIQDVPGYLRARYEASPDRALEQWLESDLDVLRILLFVGKADGQLRAAEKAIIRKTAIAMANDSRITDELIDSTLREMSVPTLQAFKVAVGRFAPRDAELRTQLVDAARAMIATQKAVHPAEAEALAYMEKKLQSAGAAPT